jgi:hypothetical protein
MMEDIVYIVIFDRLPVFPSVGFLTVGWDDLRMKYLEVSQGGPVEE